MPAAAGGAGRSAALLAGAVLLHLALYAGSLGGAFTFDDHAVVEKGAEVNGRAPLVDVFFRSYFPDNVMDYRPVTLLSLGADVRLLGLSPSRLRLMNFVWAGLGAGLFALLALELGAGVPAAWALVLLITCHPVRSEAVISIVSRSELLAFAFGALALLLLARSLGSVPEGGGPLPTPAALPAALSGVAFLLALFSKENAFALPVAGLFLVERRRGKSGAGVGGEIRRLAPLWIPWLVAIVAALLMRRSVLGGWLSGAAAVVDPIDNHLHALAPGTRALAALSLLPLAAARLTFPLTLAADYGSSALPLDELLSPPSVASGALLLFLTVAMTALVFRSRPLLAFGLLVSLSGYVPFCNLFFPTAVTFAERLLYAPAAGVALAAVGALELLGERRGRLLPALLVVTLGALGAVRVLLRIPEWRDGRTVFAAAARDYPGNGRAWFNLAAYSVDVGDLGTVEKAMRNALTVHPELARLAARLAGRCAGAGRRDAAGAIARAFFRPGEPGPTPVAVLDPKAVAAAKLYLLPEERPPGQRP